MNIDELKKRIKAIEDCKGDDEAAHGMQDALYEAVLLAIARGEVDAIELAELVLTVRDIKFFRWYA